MAENKPKKSNNKTGEMLLGILGSLGSLAGPLIFGPEFNLDLGQPFKLGSAYLQQNRLDKSLAEVLNSNPHTQGLPELVGQAAQSGGLPALLGLGQAPQQLSAPQSPAPSLLGGQELQAPGLDMLMPMPQEAAPMPQQAPQDTPVDINSMEFLQALAQARPDLAEQILVKQAGPSTSNPMDEINAMLKINQLMAFETPEQKRAAQRERDIELDEMYRDRALDVKIDSAQLKREEWSDSEMKGLLAHNDATFALQNMLNDFRAGGMPSDMAKVLSGNAFASGVGTRMGVVSPRDIQMSRDINKMVMSVVKRQSGVQYGFRELQWIKATQPSQWDSPVLFENGLKMALNNNLFNKYDLIVTKAERAGNAEVALREGMTPEQIKAFQILKKRLGSEVKQGQNDSRLFADPINKKLLETLGMNLLTSTVGK